MSYHIVAPKAQADLDGIWEAVAEVDQDAADGLVDSLTARLPILARFPHLGRLRTQVAPGIRSFSYRRYLILYRVVDEGVQIVRVVHGRRDVEAILRDTD